LARRVRIFKGYAVLMIRLAPNDIISVSSGKSFHHAVVLGKQALFGGSLCYVFHERSGKPRDASHFLTRQRPGFHAIVDWVVPNRESRVTRIAKGIDASLYKAPGLFKHTLVDLIRDTFPDEPRKPALWKIVDEKFRERKRTRRLTEAEKRLPDFSCLSGDYALKLARKKWVPEADERIERLRNGRTA
jgi:hypothetical protein